MGIVLIVVALLVLMVILVKFKELKHHFFYKALTVVILLFLGSIVFVWITSGINISTYDGFLSLGRTYFSWLGSLAGNVGSITGNVAEQDWGVNSTIVP